MSDVRNLLRGEPGTTVNVTVDREGEPDPLVFTLTREQVQLDNVTYSGYTDAASSVGYVKLERFAREAGQDVQRAIQQLQQEGELRGLILDLRDNPGGLLDAAVDVSELFVPQGSVIVSTRGRSPDSERIYRSERAPVAPDVPLVVLVNGFSASASEIVAGAMQDLDRGVVMGTTTYGKGLVQVVKSLPYNTSLKMTTAKYYTPSGRSIQSIEYENGEGTATPDSAGRAFKTKAGRTVRDRHGIEPDVDISATTPSELEEALQRRAAFFFYANHFAAENETIDVGFTVDDATLADFQAWLNAQSFDYRTDGERSVTKLQEEFAAIGYESVHDEIADLRRAVEDEKQAGFQRHAADLKHHLQEEILARFVTESEQIRAELGYDPQVQEAVSLLQSDDSYARILSVR
jgi:carboxyl-terminal processing protease